MEVRQITTGPITLGRRPAGVPQEPATEPADLFKPKEPQAPTPTEVVQRWSTRAGWAGAAVLMGCGVAGAMLPGPFNLPFRIINGAYVGGSLGAVVASLGSAAVLGRNSKLAEKIGIGGAVVGAAAGVATALLAPAPYFTNPAMAAMLPGAMSVMWGSIGVDTAVEQSMESQAEYRTSLENYRAKELRRGPEQNEVGQIEFEEDTLQVGDYELPL